MSDTPITDRLSTDPAIEKRDVPARVWREMEALERKCAALRKDAERYRWWRKNYGVAYDGPNSWKLYTLVSTYEVRESENFDAAIDAEIAKAKP